MEKYGGDLADPTGLAKRPEHGSAAADEVLYVDGQLYENLTAATALARAQFGPSDAKGAELREIERFLLWEARLLDMRRYRDWLRLMSDDCIYWVPSSPVGVDPRQAASINFDDRRRLIDRITLIETGIQAAQIPPSRTCRMISNVEAWPGQEIYVRSNIVVWEYRRGSTNAFAGYQEHYLLPAAQFWKIKRKVINLLNCDQPQGNITFII